MIEDNCEWVSFCGNDADDWEETADWVDVERYLKDSNDESVLMTTSHRLEDVSDAVGMIANLSGPPYDNVLVLGIGAPQGAFETARAVFSEARPFDAA